MAEGLDSVKCDYFRYSFGYNSARRGTKVLPLISSSVLDEAGPVRSVLVSEAETKALSKYTKGKQSVIVSSRHTYLLEKGDNVHI